MNRFDAMLAAPKTKLFVSLPANSEEMAAAALAEGADGIKLHINVGHRASSHVFGPLADYDATFRRIRSRFEGPIGIVPGGRPHIAPPEDMAALADIGFDYISVFCHHMPSYMLNNQMMARTFAVDSMFDPGLLEEIQSYGCSGIETSIVPGDEYGSPLNMKDLLQYRQLARISGLPLIIPSQRKWTTDDVPALVDCGAKVLLIGAIVTGKGEESIRRSVAEFRNALDRM